jgi:hypothetical protein
MKGLYNHKRKDYKFNNKVVFMPVIYKPKGAAGEYGEYVVTHQMYCIKLKKILIRFMPGKIY